MASKVIWVLCEDSYGRSVYLLRRKVFTGYNWVNKNEQTNSTSMPVNSSVKFTIAFNDPDLDSEELEEQAQSLLAQMRDLDEIETVDRPHFFLPTPNP